jgi:hypothetical protein
MSSLSSMPTPNQIKNKQKKNKKKQNKNKKKQNKNKKKQNKKYKNFLLNLIRKSLVLN